MALESVFYDEEQGNQLIYMLLEEEEEGNQNEGKQIEKEKDDDDKQKEDTQKEEVEPKEGKQAEEIKNNCEIEEMVTFIFNVFLYKQFDNLGRTGVLCRCS